MEDRDLFPNESYYWFIGGVWLEAEVLVGGGGDTGDPGDVTDGVLEVGGHLAERGRGDDGEHALHEVVVTALEDQGDGLVEDLLGVGDNAPEGFSSLLG